MIGKITGNLIHKSNDWVLIDSAGVGYKIFVNAVLLDSLKIDQAAALFTHLYVREDMLNLYGFKSIQGLEFFELLISVSGIGPKAALGILNIGSVDYLKKAIEEKRSDILTGVSGVGKKTAERVILELREKVGLGNINLPKQFSSEDEDILTALVGLGYKKTEARDAMLKITTDSLSEKEKIKEALKFLGK